jgi:uncharacterized protein (TIGR02246 family)
VVLYEFFASLESNNRADPYLFLADDVQFIDFRGKKWSGREEIKKQFDVLFVPYAKRGVTHSAEMEIADLGTYDCVAASVLWENVVIPSETARMVHRMTVILAKEAGTWAISLIQVTPVIVR